MGLGDRMRFFDKDGSASANIIFIKGEAGGGAPSNGIAVFGRLRFHILQVGFRGIHLLSGDDKGITGDGSHQVLCERTSDIVRGDVGGARIGFDALHDEQLSRVDGGPFSSVSLPVVAVVSGVAAFVIPAPAEAG